MKFNELIYWNKETAWDSNFIPVLGSIVHSLRRKNKHIFTSYPPWRYIGFRLKQFIGGEIKGLKRYTK